MWIFGDNNVFPSKVSEHWYVESVPMGYQYTSIRFKIDADETADPDQTFRIGVSIPIAPNKENGGLRFIENEDLDEIVGHANAICIDESNSQFYHTRLRDIRNLDGINQFDASDFINWYLDDFGVLVATVEPNKWYKLDYQHKIASNSKLFVPTRLPVRFSERKIPVDFDLWVNNAQHYDVQSHLKCVNSKTAKNVNYTIAEVEEGKPEWGWIEDTEFSTNNWDSSDDESDQDEA